MRRAARPSAGAAGTPGAALVAIGSTASSNSSDIALSCRSEDGTGARGARSWISELYLVSSHCDDRPLVTPACESDAARREFPVLSALAPAQTDAHRASRDADHTIRLAQSLRLSRHARITATRCCLRAELRKPCPCRLRAAPSAPSRRAARPARAATAAPRRFCAWASARFRNALP